MSLVVGAMRYRLMPARTENEMGEGDAWRAHVQHGGFRRHSAQRKADEHEHPTSSICPLHCIVGGLGWLSVCTFPHLVLPVLSVTRAMIVSRTCASAERLGRCGIGKG